MSGLWQRIKSFAKWKENIENQSPHLEFSISYDWFGVDRERMRPTVFNAIYLSEYIFFYFWLAKDWCWNQTSFDSDWYYAGWVLGLLSVVFWIVPFSLSVYERNWTVCYCLVGEEIWLVGNWVWMHGEINDLHKLGDWGDGYETATTQASHLFYAGIAWMGFYYFVVRPLGLLEGTLGFTDRTEKLSKIRNLELLSPRFPWYMRDWSEYWFAHILTWVTKDLAWTILNPVLQLIFVWATLALAVDYALKSWFRRGRFFAHMHYVAYVLWISANAVWAWGDLFFPDDATTHFSMARDPPSWTELRWWAAWIFMSAFALVFVAWLSVLFALLTGHVLDEPHEEDIIQDEYVDYLGGSSHHKKIPRDEFN